MRGKKVEKGKALELESRRDWMSRLLANKDFVKFLTALELENGAMAYGTEEVDEFTQGKLAMLGEIKQMLAVSELAPKVFGEITRRFYQGQTDKWQYDLAELTKKETEK